MSLPLQGKLLRVLQEREFERVEGTESIKTDARVITASHRNREKAVREKRVREDLFYRLNVIQINIPPLRERKDDIYPLAEFFMQKHHSGKGMPKVTGETIKILRSYAWPDNVRELENASQWAITLSQGDNIFPDALPPQIFKQDLEIALPFENMLEEKLADLVVHMGGLETCDIYSMVIRPVKKTLITLILQKTGGSQVRAAHLLGIHRNMLRKKISKMGIKGPFDSASKKKEGIEEYE